jgi:hypothetical protein
MALGPLGRSEGKGVREVAKRMEGKEEEAREKGKKERTMVEY